MPSETRQRPNILYILSDQHSASVLGCYGEKLDVTPNLDRLADTGAVFSSTYCPSPICVPSRMAMLTGLDPHEIDVWTNRDTLGSGFPTFLHALGSAGYDTTLIGRMHSLGPDQLRGYARRFVGDHQSNYWGNGEASRGTLTGTAGPDFISLERSGVGLSPYEVHDEDVTSSAVAFLRKLGSRRREGLQSQPFMLSLGYMLPHAPFVARATDLAQFLDDVSLPVHRQPFSDSLHPFIKWWRSYTRIESVDDVTIRRARAAYWTLVHRLDAMIGEVLTALDQYGLRDNTMVVYTSDHGDQLGERDLWWKHTFYEESVRVPALLSWAGRIDPGTRVANVSRALDLTATMLAAAQAQQLPDSTARNLLPLLEHQSHASWDDFAYSEYCTDELSPPGGIRHRMLRADEWKFVYYDGQPPQLFNLQEDPAELYDCVADQSLARLRQDLQRMTLEGWSPTVIKRRMERNRQDAELIGAWARATHPTERFQWPMMPEMSRLDGYDDTPAAPTASVEC